MVAEGELGLGGVKRASGEFEIGLAVALKSVAGQDVEDAVGAVANVGGVRAALDLKLVDVLGVNLRADVGGDFGVGDGDAVNEPTGLMSAANVEHVVGHVSAGDVVGDHLHAEGAGCAGSADDLLAGDEGGGSDGAGVDVRIDGAADDDGLAGVLEWQGNVKDGAGA